MNRFRLVLSLVLIGLCSSALQAQSPGFKNLRFDEDWSSVDEDLEGVHLFPAIKWIELDDDWALSTGGQIRWRSMREVGRSLMPASPRVNDFNLLRTRVHAEVRNVNGFRAFVEVLDARIYGEDRAPLGIDRNNADVHNAFVEFIEGDTLLRAGRFEMQFGAQRFVSPLEWGNTRRRFEGVLARQDFDGGRADFFITHPVAVDAQHTDHDNDSLWFSGAYLTFPDESGGTDAYLLALNETTASLTSGSGRRGPMDVYTAGARRWGKSGQFDYEAELALQFGEFAGDQVEAQSISARAGWSEPDLPGSPRFGLDFDWASGDSDPTDSRQETFNQLFPLGHAYLGKLDLVGRQNIIDLQPNVAVSLDERTKLKLEQHFFRLEDRHDSLYNAGGGATLTDATGGAGTDVGRELDVILSHQLESLAPHAQVVLGYSRFSPGEFVDTLGSQRHVELFYTQFTFTF
ncbi:MAG: alginate export family protein [Planctomycetota bacterium]|nr:MAG: alginate export family protein [Planctomycetota bacterium]